MCGRYRLSRRKELLAEHFDADLSDLDWEPRYNIAPTQPVPVVRQKSREDRPRLSLMRWGLIPSWAADPSIGTHMINARSETVAARPAFREPLRKQRCLVPADGFYEWKRSRNGKQPFCFEVGNGAIFAFAGFWDCWQAVDGTPVETCTILTNTPNELLADIHDRMPVILPRNRYYAWLDPGIQDVLAALEMLKPFDSNLMRRFAVSAMVNRVTNDGPECCAPVELPAATGSLFLLG
jgi:putative SOS response-associated peptidase YedK